MIGWSEDKKAFVIGDHTIDATEVITGAGSLKPMTPRGSLKDWRVAAQAMFASGFEVQAAALLASFGSILLPFITHKGRCVLSLHSTGYQQGATTAMVAASSVWGDLGDCHLPPRSPTAEKQAIVDGHGCLPLIFDDLRQTDPVAAGAFVSSYIKGEPPAVLLVASDTSLEALLTGQNQPLHILELPVQLPRIMKPDPSLQKTLQANSGHAGRAFAQASAKIGAGTLISMMERMKKEYDRALDVQKPEHHHISWLLSSIAVAARILHAMELFEFDAQRISDWLVVQARKRMGVVADQEDFLAAVCQIIDRNSDSMLIVSGPYTGMANQCRVWRKPLKDLHMRYEIAGGRLYVSNNLIRSQMALSGLKLKETVDAMLKTKVLISSQRYLTLTAGTGGPAGQVKCWEFDFINPAAKPYTKFMTKLLKGAT